MNVFCRSGHGVRYPAHLGYGVVRAQHASAQGYARDSRAEDFRYVSAGDAAYGHQRYAYTAAPHPRHDVPVAFKAEHRGEVLLGGGEAEGATAYVIGALRDEPAYIVEGICGTAYYEAVSGKPARLVHRHVVLAEMHSVRSGAERDIEIVVHDEYRAAAAAQRKYAPRSALELVCGSVLHAQLDPAAASLKGDAYGVQVGDVLRKMGDKLYLKAHFSKYIRNGEAPRMCGGRAKHSKSPYDGTDRIRFDGCNLSLRATPREAPLFSCCKDKRYLFC